MVLRAERRDPVAQTRVSTPPVEHRPEYLGREEADRLMAHLLDATPWQTSSMTMYGRTIAMPRLIAWYADAPYSFSGSTQQPHDWTSELAELRDRLATDTGARYNSVLLNLYRDGQDSISWHSDDEPELGPTPTIASLSLGATRDFVMRRRDDHAVKTTIPLTHGGLVVMRGDSQSAWQHAVPKRTRVVEPRINLTFRWFEPRSSRA